MRRLLLIAAALVAVLWYRNWTERERRRELFSCRMFAAGDAGKLRRCLKRVGWNERDATAEYRNAQEAYTELLDATMAPSSLWKRLSPPRTPPR